MKQRSALMVVVVVMSCAAMMFKSTAQAEQCIKAEESHSTHSGAACCQKKEPKRDLQEQITMSEIHGETQEGSNGEVYKGNHKEEKPGAELH